MAGEPASVREQFREFFALERDVLVLSVAMFAFSLGFQMTSRYLAEYMVALGASVFVVLGIDAGSMTDARVVEAFSYVLAIAVAFAIGGTLAQHVLYDTSGDDFGKEFASVSQIADDLRNLPSELRPLLVGDTLVWFGNGMVYVFFVIVVTRFLSVGVSLTLPIVGTSTSRHRRISGCCSVSRWRLRY